MLCVLSELMIEYEYEYEYEKGLENIGRALTQNRNSTAWQRWLQTVATVARRWTRTANVFHRLAVVKLRF